MLSLKYSIDDRIDIDGEVYEVNAMFDVMLRVVDLTMDEKLPPGVRVSTALVLLIGTKEQVDKHMNPHVNYEFLDKYSIEDRAVILEQILNKYMSIKDQDVPVDRAGNPMPIVESDDEEELMDFDYDAEEIYASFMQAYHMDLIEQQGKLHWFKFKALLSGLPDETPIKQLISIRGWEPDNDKKKYSTRMREAQDKVRIRKK